MTFYLNQIFFSFFNHTTAVKDFKHEYWDLKEVNEKMYKEGIYFFL